MPCVHKNWTSVPLPAFFGHKDSQRTTATPRNIFHDRHLYNGRYTQLTCLSDACQACSLFFITCNQLISISFQNFCILAIKEKQFPWTFMGHNLPATGFSIVHNIRFSSHFLLHLKAQENFNYYNLVNSPF